MTLTYSELAALPVGTKVIQENSDRMGEVVEYRGHTELLWQDGKRSGKLGDLTGLPYKSTVSLL